MIVDDRTVLTGSLNWSKTSELKTLENLIILDRPAIAKAYADRFKMKWNYGKGSLAEVLKQIGDNDSREQTYFSPISLKGDQVRRISE